MKYTAEIQAAILAARAAGERSHKKIAERFLMPPSSVGTIIKRGAVSTAKRYPSGVRAAIVERYDAGDQPKHISESLGIPISAVNNILRRAYVKRHHKIGEIKELVVKHALLGQSPNEIAREVGCSANYAREVIRTCVLQGHD